MLLRLAQTLFGKGIVKALADVLDELSNTAVTKIDDALPKWVKVATVFGHVVGLVVCEPKDTINAKVKSKLLTTKVSIPKLWSEDCFDVTIVVWLVVVPKKEWTKS